jgi:hypothetical protein
MNTVESFYYPGQTRTVVNDRKWRNTAINGEKKRSFTILVYGARIQLPFHNVFPVYDRNTGSCNTPKYGRKRPCAECVTFDLGSYQN